MKDKISRILGVGLSLMLLASLMVFATPASAADLAWTQLKTIPGDVDQPLYQVIDATTDYDTDADADPLSVIDMAVSSDGMTIYAALTDVGDEILASTFLLKSTDAGETWTKVTLSSDVNTRLNAVAVAPDDADMIGIIADNQDVIISKNGGSTWTTLPTVQESGKGAASSLFDIDVSVDVSGTTYFGVAGEEGAGDNTGNVWYFDLGASMPKWLECNPASGGLDATSDQRFVAVKFSPAFASDKVLLALSGPDGSGTDTAVMLQIFSTATGNKKWNVLAGFDDYPVSNMDSIGSGKILLAGDIALPSTYLGADPDTRDAFVGYASDDATLKGTLNRLDDYKVIKELVDDTNFNSVAYNTDADKLVAGEYSSNKVHYCSDASSASSTSMKESRSKKGPSGVSGKVIVGWSGDNVVAVAQGNEGAFAVSTDDGYTFNDISLISTQLTNLTDIQVNADASKIYLISDDSADVSVWRYASSWQRVLCLPAVTITSTGWLARIAPENDEVLYIADRGGTDMYYTDNGGTTRWLFRSVGVAVQDLAVESADVAYALKSNGQVTQTTNAGFTWGTAKSTDLDSGHSIVSLGEDKLIVGSQNGYVSYSTDPPDNWTKIDKQLESGAANVQATATGLASGDIIYAASSASGDNFRKWTIGSSSSWTDISGGDYATYTGGCMGIALSGGTLYSVNDTGATSYMYRCLVPSAASSTSDDWSRQESSGERFSIAPSALRISSGPKLWAIDTATTPDILWYLNDLAAAKGPTLLGPANGKVIAVNAETGRAQDVAFSWSRLSKATDYDLEIALDKSFNEIARQEISLDPAEDPSTVSFMLGPFSSIPIANVGGTGTTFEYQAGVTYYWRVRISQDGPIYSPWSEVRSFEVAPLVAFSTSGPVMGASNISRMPTLTWNAHPLALSYEVALSEDPTFTIIDRGYTSDYTFVAIDEALDYSTTYYWRVRAVTGEAPPCSGKTCYPPPTSEWVTGVFTTEAEPVAPTPPVVVEQPTEKEVQVIEVPVTKVVQQAIPDYLLWVIVIIGAVLLIALIVLIVRTRRIS